MTKIKSQCLEAFNRGLEARKAYPLPSGRYKLKEVRRGLGESLQTLNEINSAKCAERDRQPRRQRPKVPEGAARLIKLLPEWIAHDLGYYVIPAVEALAGDGLPAAQVKMLALHARKKSADIVQRCDAVHDRLRNGIGVEYAHMTHGDSMLEPLLRDAIRLIDEMLQAVDGPSAVS